MRRHEITANPRAIVFYAAVTLIVLLCGLAVTYAFFERESLAAALEPEPLPRITIVTSNDASPLVAAWVAFLTKAGFSATIVSPERLSAADNVIAICDTPSLPPASRPLFSSHASVVVLGAAPANFPGVVTERVEPVTGLKFGVASSPLLARISPGLEIPAQQRVADVVLESPSMNVDLRWIRGARAAAMHAQSGRRRIAWVGIDPRNLPQSDERILAIFFRSLFRWVAGQAISDGAAGDLTAARAMTPSARASAQAAGFAFSVERLRDSSSFAVRFSNRGKSTLRNPTVMVWTPPGASHVELAGNPLMTRRVTLTAQPENGAIVLSVPLLGGGEQRTFRIRVR